VTEQILNAPPPIRRRSPYGSSAKRSPSAPSDLVYRYRWTLSAVGLLALSTLIVLWARTRPGYEPYGWLVWGHLAIHLQLDTNGAPSWKPLPFLFTLPYAVVGHYALWLWMITSVAISLAGVAFVWRLAFRLTDAPPERRYAAYAAGLCAGLALIGIAGIARRLTPARILACGQPNIPIAFQSVLARYLGTNTGRLYFSPNHKREHPYPVVEMYPHFYGWQVVPSHAQSAAQAARRRDLRLRT
jgi:hypothetical protein